MLIIEEKIDSIARIMTHLFGIFYKNTMNYN